MSGRMKAGAELVALLGVWGFYFVRLTGAIRSGEVASQGFVSTLGWTLGACVLLSILLSVALDLVADLGRRRRAQARDEREAWAGLRATRLAHGTLVAILLLFAALGILLGANNDSTLLVRHIEPWLHGVMGNGLILVAHAALAAYLLAEVVHYGALIVLLGRDR